MMKKCYKFSLYFLSFFTKCSRKIERTFRNLEYKNKAAKNHLACRKK